MDIITDLAVQAVAALVATGLIYVLTYIFEKVFGASKCFSSKVYAIELLTLLTLLVCLDIYRENITLVTMFGNVLFVCGWVWVDYVFKRLPKDWTEDD